MNTITRRLLIRSLAGAGLISALIPGMPALGQTPTAVGCADKGTPQGTSDMRHEGHGGMSAGTPMAGMHDVEFDQMYIDMMLPHHASVIALAEAAQPVLKDPRLKEMAKNIITTQTDEQTLMQDLREEWYGSREPEPLTTEIMNVTMGHSSCDFLDMDDMMNAMDEEWQVETFLAADDPDLAFIEQTLLHHQMAIDSSEVALKQAVHPELKEIAQDVIDAQQEEIDTLEKVRSDLTGEATPAS